MFVKEHSEVYLTATLLYIAVFLLLFAIFILFWCLLVLIIKRFHDLDRSGWNILIWLIPVFGSIASFIDWIRFFFVKGTEGPNRFGDSSG